MLKPLVLGVVLGLCSATYVTAEEFDPGVPAPKVGADYYNGAEKVVFHLSTLGDEKQYLTVLGNVSNYMKAIESTGKKAEALVVMNADGLTMLKLAKDIELENEAKLPNRITELKAKGVKFQICYNTLTARKIKLDTLYEAKAEDVIPSGVAEVGRLEALGYRMIKP